MIESFIVGAREKFLQASRAPEGALLVFIMFS